MITILKFGHLDQNKTKYSIYSRSATHPPKWFQYFVDC